MRKRPGRVCNKLCSPGVRRFQLVPCVPARQTPKEMAQALVARDRPLLFPFGYWTRPLGRMQRVSDFSTRRRRPRTKTRTSAITHDFFLFSPRGNPQDWQPVRKTWRGDKPGRVVCVTWGAGLTWCPRVGAGRIPVLSLDQGDGRPDGTGFERRWPGGRRISSVLGQAGLGDSSGTHSWVFLGRIRQE